METSRLKNAHPHPNRVIPNPHLNEPNFRPPVNGIPTRSKEPINAAMRWVAAGGLVLICGLLGLATMMYLGGTNILP